MNCITIGRRSEWAVVGVVWDNNQKVCSWEQVWVSWKPLESRQFCIGVMGGSIVCKRMGFLIIALYSMSIKQRVVKSRIRVHQRLGFAVFT